MNLKIYDFRKKVDVRAAIDLLNHLIADCIVSEAWIEMHVKVPDYLTGAVDAEGKPISGDSPVLANILRDMLCVREKVMTYWLCLHHALHLAIEEKEEISDKTQTYFDLMWAMFDMNRAKLLKFIKDTPYSPGSCTSLRKQWYGQRHYITKRDIYED
jgi:hypothetical protein